MHLHAGWSKGREAAASGARLGRQTLEQGAETAPNRPKHAPCSRVCGPSRARLIDFSAVLDRSEGRLGTRSTQQPFFSAFLAKVSEDEAANVVAICIGITVRRNWHFSDVSFRAPRRRVYVKPGRKFVIVSKYFIFVVNYSSSSSVFGDDSNYMLSKML